MTVRAPLYWDGSSLKEMSSSQVTEITNRAVHAHGSNASAIVSVVGSGGNISPGMADTRMTAGASRSFSNRFPSEGETAEPGNATVTYDRISQSNTSVATPSDTNNKAYPAYWNGTDIQAMNATDVFDTFLNSAISTLVDGSDRPGTFRIHSSSSLSGHSLQSGTPVFTDSRANTAAYTAAGIPESVDQSQTISNYYLFRTNQGAGPSYTAPLQIDSSNNLQQYSDSTLDAMLLAELRHHTVNTVGSRILYSINGSGSNRGSGMVNTKLNGSGNFQTRFINTNDYRAQEFPNGSAITVESWFLRIRRG